MFDSISVSTTSPEREEKAIELAKTLNITVAELDKTQLQLVITEQHIEIRAPELGNPIFVDFEQGKNAHRRQFGGGRGQPLAKAIGLKKGATPSVIDTTAGFGRDAFVLANLGCQIRLIERNPYIAILLNDALSRAHDNDDIADVISNMRLINQDSVAFLTDLTDDCIPDVIYMDPMYPSREKSALVKKDMRLLHQLAGPDTDSEHLLAIARQRAKNRVVVKRPKSAEFIANQKPSTSIESKNTRYDIYVIS
jgi:16S rRNA (guanine1516-N2)-methyltransferase